MPALEDFISETLECGTEEDLYAAFQGYLDNFDIEFFAYFIIAHHLRAVTPETGLITYNFPEEFANLYIEKRYMAVDPIVHLSLKRARPFHWRDVKAAQTLNAQQKQLFIDQRNANLIDGLAVPVFGPMGTIATFALSKEGQEIELSNEQLLFIQSACLHVNNRYFHLNNINGDAPTKRLSRREKQALSLVADGLPTPVIAEKLGITENTVDTMLRRIFIKLGVNSRISAVLKAIGSGEIVL